MSGGYFGYDQDRINRIIDDIDGLIRNNDSTEMDFYGQAIGKGFSDETIKEFKTGLYHLRIAYIYAQRIDWLVSNDDSEPYFHKRLKDDLEKNT